MAGARTPLMQQQRNRTATQILRCLLRDGPQGRKQLTAATGRSSTTVTKVINELLGAGAVIESTPPPVRGAGRPQVPLELSPDRVVVGIHLYFNRIIVCVYSLRGEELASATEHHQLAMNDPDRDFSTVVAAAAELTDQVLESVPGTPVGAGVATGGGWQGGDNTGPNQWRIQEIEEMLSARMTIPVTVDTNVNALALEQHWWDHIDGDVLTLFVGRSIGIAHMCNDSLQLGRFGRGGSIDHLVVPGSTALCDCGARGCVEATCGNFAVHAAAVEQGILPPDTPLLVMGGPPEQRLPALEPLCVERAFHLGRMLPIVLRMYEPERTIIRGGMNATEQQACLGTAADQYRAITGTSTQLECRPILTWPRASATLALDAWMHQPLGQLRGSVPTG